VRTIVLDHGGHIELKNRKEGGLRVIVSLPLGGQ
jgi:two-component system OmpR family sensor kinase